MKKAIFVASFGDFIDDSRKKYIEIIEVDNMEMCLDKLKENGYTHVYVVITFIIPGTEYEIILKTIEKYRNDFEEIKIFRTFSDDNMGKKETDVIESYTKTDLNNKECIERKHDFSTENYKFFQNTKCEFFPCHKTDDVENFNCLFCYCPLYALKGDCGGNYVIKNGIKDCSNCLVPHSKEGYERIMSKIKDVIKLGSDF